MLDTRIDRKLDEAAKKQQDILLLASLALRHDDLKPTKTQSPQKVPTPEGDEKSHQGANSSSKISVEGLEATRSWALNIVRVTCLSVFKYFKHHSSSKTHCISLQHSVIHSSLFAYSSAGASSAAFSSAGASWASSAGASAYSTGSGCYYSVASSGYLSDLVAD